MLKSSYVKVTYREGHFVITDPDCNGKLKGDKSIKSCTFIDPKYRYQTDFESKFLKVFEGKTQCIIDVSAKNKIQEIMEFNRME